MSETVQKVFKIRKVIPGDVLFIIHPMSNMDLSKTIVLTDRNPVKALPLDWALGIFLDTGNYNLYKQGVFTFEDNDEMVRLAYESGAYFDDKLDFKPAKQDNEKAILAVLMAGNRAAIEKCIKDHGEAIVKQIAIMHVDELSNGVTRMLESMFKIQLLIDGGDAE